MLTAAMFKRQWPRASAQLVGAVLQSQASVLTHFEINTPLRLAHFLGQVTVESTNGTRLDENLNYTAARLVEVWPKRFPTIAAAREYANNPEKLANKVYGGRMGNGVGNGDGWRYRGGGLIQLTGKDNYEAIGKIAMLDLTGKPELARAPDHALLIAGAFWHRAKCNGLADGDVVQAVTKRINGGQIGLHERIASTNAWKSELGV